MKKIKKLIKNYYYIKEDEKILSSCQDMWSQFILKSL